MLGKVSGLAANDGQIGLWLYLPAKVERLLDADAMARSEGGSERLLGQINGDGVRRIDSVHRNDISLDELDTPVSEEPTVR
jgi:hypothetical protein